MRRSPLYFSVAATLVLLAVSLPAAAQSFRVQCPTHTTLHPLVTPTADNPTGANPGIKCQQLSGGDGFATMADGTQTYLFSFGPLSGLANMVQGLPGTVTAAEFNQSNLDGSGNILDVIKIGAPYPGYDFNGAIGYVPEQDSKAIQSISFGNNTTRGTNYRVGDTVVFSGGGALQDATGHVSAVGNNNRIQAIVINNGGTGYQSAPTVTVLRDASPSGRTGTTATPTAVLSSTDTLTGHVDPRLIMDVGVLNGNIPAPLIAIDEGDELFLTLTNVGQVMRPDLFEQHTVHFHGYPNASAFYDGVPDASVAINIGGSFTYYYLAPEAGTYMWHCHISPPEHLQMGMVGQLYVRPKQYQSTAADLGTALKTANQISATSGDGVKCNDILCAGQTPLPAGANPTTGATSIAGGGKQYAYNDGDGSTAYDVEYPIQMHGFDPNFHFVGMTFNPESFADNKDKYFLLNGRSYPDTINPDALSTQSSDGVERYSQPMRSLINIPVGKKALLRFSDLNVTEYHTLASLGIPMHVIAVNARLLRDMDGNNLYYDTNSITLAGGESVDVILDASDTTKYPSGSVFYLYTPQLDHLSNDAENFGGMMTEVRIN